MSITHWVWSKQLLIQQNGRRHIIVNSVYLQQIKTEICTAIWKGNIVMKKLNCWSAC